MTTRIKSLLLAALLLVSCAVTLPAQTGVFSHIVNAGRQKAGAGITADFVSAQADANTVPVGHAYYTALWSKTDKTPVYVAYVLTPEMVTKDGVSRADEFLPDPDNEWTSWPQDYTRNGMNLDRGHMMPAADCKFSGTAMAESFYMTNVCPQNHSLNEGPWCDLEKQVRFWCKHYYKTTLLVACGPVYSDNGITVRIGENRVAVPDSFWKVVCRKDGRTGRYEAAAFLFPNSDLVTDYRSCAVSVDDIERITGLDFFSGFDGEDDFEAVTDGTGWKF